MRVAVLLRDRCYPNRCALECIKYCPRVRMGDETITLDPEGKPVISEQLCIGCGICVHRCPFDAIRIINLAEELATQLMHQYGPNAFRLFHLPCPQKGVVLGILGRNGIGKTTAMQILSGALIPNMGSPDPSWDKVLPKVQGIALRDYLSLVATGDIRSAIKRQQIALPQGSVKAALQEAGQRGKVTEVIDQLALQDALTRDTKELSGGEAQRVAIAITLLQDADLFCFDEPSSYLDVYQRLRAARAIRSLSDRMVVVVEHDLAVLDLLADWVCILYGEEGAYGVVTAARKTRVAINTYLSGYLRQENVRFGDAIKFESRPTHRWEAPVTLEFGPLVKRYADFALSIERGAFHKGEVVGVVGPNATGKTTFVQMLAGITEPSEGVVDRGAAIAYKPQYLRPCDGTVGALLGDNRFVAELGIGYLLEREARSLSGGELQMAAIAHTLNQRVELYLMDEPSAHLDVSQRTRVAKVIGRAMKATEATALIVDHDVYFLDIVSDALMVFSGKPSVRGLGQGPFDMRSGMNRFLRAADLTFRRDPDSNRPRINKPGSRIDREQRAEGEYYYV